MNLFVGGMLLSGAVAVALFSYHRYTASPPLSEEWGMEWRWALVAGVWLISAFAAWTFIRQLPQGELEFDGENWYFVDQVGTASVRFDGQNCLLLRFESEFKKISWLWLDAGFEPKHWHDLRRAVYSRPVKQNSLDLI